MASDAIAPTLPIRGRLTETPADYNRAQPDYSGLTRFLGWFSIGLGISEIIMPGVIARLSGTRNHKGLIRFYGLREVAAGVGILSQPKPANWLWARVAGDLVDLASIAGGSREDHRGATVGALTAVAGVTVLDVICAQNSLDSPAGAQQLQHAETSLLINRPLDECYACWRDVENMPRFASQIRTVRVTGDKTSHWTARCPGISGDVEWDAEIVDDIPNQRISWRSIPGAGPSVNGAVNFEAAPNNRGTIVRLQLDYEHPGSTLATPVAKFFGKEPSQLLQKSLRRLKQLLELGEILTTEGQPAGRPHSVTWLDALAR